MKRDSFEKFIDKLDNNGLRIDVKTWAMRMNVSLRDLYEGVAGRGSSVVAARRVVYAQLMKNGKSLNEVARIFDRAPSGVFRLVKDK